MLRFSPISIESLRSCHSVPFEEPGGAFGLPFGRRYKGPGPLLGTRAVGGITSRDRK